MLKHMLTIFFIIVVLFGFGKAAWLLSLMRAIQMIAVTHDILSFGVSQSVESAYKNINPTEFLTITKLGVLAKLNKIMWIVNEL